MKIEHVDKRRSRKINWPNFGQFFLSNRHGFLEGSDEITVIYTEILFMQPDWITSTVKLNYKSCHFIEIDRRV